MLQKKLIWFMIGILFLVLGVIFTFMRPDSLVDIIDIDLQKRTFSGSMQALMFLIAIICIVFTFRETKKDVLQDAKKSLNEAAEKWRIAADAMEGKIITIHFRIGPDTMIPEFKRLFAEGKLRGEYVVKQKSTILKEGDLLFFEEPASKIIMADVEDVPMDPDTLIEVMIKEDSRIWRASESVRVRLISMELERG